MKALLMTNTSLVRLLETMKITGLDNVELHIDCKGSKAKETHCDIAFQLATYKFKRKYRCFKPI